MSPRMPRLGGGCTGEYSRVLVSAGVWGLPSVSYHNEVTHSLVLPRVPGGTIAVKTGLRRFFSHRPGVLFFKIPMRIVHAAYMAFSYAHP